MILLAALIGALLGGGLIWQMQRSGMLSERSGAAILLGAVASFYPVFAVIEGDPLGAVLHIAIFVLFGALAMRAYHRGMLMIAGGLIAHGIFDIAAGLIDTPGPVWWPAFCAAFDIVAGVAMVRLIQRGKITT